MSRSRTSKTGPTDMHQVLTSHMEATAEARRWATEGIKLAKVGKKREALAAEKKALAALKRMEQIEAPYRRARP